MKNNVKEYWIINPSQKHILVYNKDGNNEIKYTVVHFDERITSKTIPSLELDLTRMNELVE
jgi:Uma2 family endonuclease